MEEAIEISGKVEFAKINLTEEKTMAKESMACAVDKATGWGGFFALAGGKRIGEAKMLITLLLAP